MDKIYLLKHAYVMHGATYPEDPSDVAVYMPTAIGDVILGVPYAEHRRALDLALSGKSNVTNEDILDENQNRLLGGLFGGAAGIGIGANLAGKLARNRVGRLLLGALGAIAGAPIGAAVGSRVAGTGHYAIYGPGPSEEDVHKFKSLLANIG